MGVDRLEAGPETDVLVAEKVMGWKRVTRFHDAPIADGWLGFWAGEWFRWIERPDGEGEWHPSTDIVAACEMEEMIEQRGFNLRYAQALMAVFLFDGLEPECDEALWWAFIDASSIQRCRAALKVVNGG